MSWPMVKLGSLFKVTSGGTPSRAVAEYYEDGQIPWVKTGDLHNKYVEQASEYITEAGLKSSSTRLYPAGTVLVAMYGATIGACSILAIEACTNQACAAFTPNPNVDVDYLYYFLKHSKTAFVNAGAGGAQPNISAGFLKDYEIPLPPLAEQKRIAAILDKADDIRRKRQQAIQLADDFLRAVFLEMFGDPVTNPKGWERCKFEDLTCLVTYGLTVRPEYHDAGIPLISAREIRTGELDFESCPKISRIDFDKLSEKGRPKINDILFSKTGSIGHCAIVKTELDFAVTQNAARIVPKTDVCEPIFLLAFMRTKFFYDLANKEAKGNAVKDLQLGVMKNFPMYIPPISVQKQFADLYAKATHLSEKIGGGSCLLSSSFSALSQKAFSGQL